MYLLDTNHCSLIFLKNQTVLDYIQEVGETDIATTIITVGELTYMASMLYRDSIKYKRGVW
jgi:tRNA(fMet)-specific endonuclease VapC